MTKFAGVNKVSFDIFDTLVHRLVLAPVDVFEMVRLRAFEDSRSLFHHDLIKNFLTSRMNAEADARAKRVRDHGGEGEITFSEIYKQWQANTGASSDLANWLKALELDCEQKVLIPSIEGKAFYKEARAAGCDIVFASDMYLPSSFLRELLVTMEFDGAQNYALYVSGEQRLSKHQGGLYEHIAQAENWPMDSAWLHVGDNQHSDVEMANRAGLNSRLASWGKVHNVPTTHGGYGTDSLIHSITQALTLPQAQERMPDDPLERIAYQTWGPMLFGFTCWLAEQFQREGNEHAVFVARDGWLMKHLFELLTAVSTPKIPTTSYFYMSRKLGFKTGVRDWHHERAWFYVSGKNNVSVRKAFSAAGLQTELYRGRLAEAGIEDLDAPLDETQKAALVHFMNTVSYDVLLENMRTRQKFAAHYDTVMPETGGVAFVDIGWVGNIQRCFLHSLSDKAAYHKVSGYYLGLHQDHLHTNAELGMKLQGWLNGSARYPEFNEALLSGGVELLEFLLTAPHGSTLDLNVTDEGIVPVLEQQGDLEKEHYEKASRAQNGVIQFFKDYQFLLNLFSPHMLSSPVWAEDFLRLVTDPDQSEVDLLACITHSDGVGENDDRIVLARALTAQETRTPKLRAKARDTAFWKGAFDKLNPELK